MRFGRVSRMRNEKHDPREKKNEKKKKAWTKWINSRRSLDGVDSINARKKKNSNQTLTRSNLAEQIIISEGLVTKSHLEMWCVHWQFFFDPSFWHVSRCIYLRIILCLKSKTPILADHRLSRISVVRTFHFTMRSNFIHNNFTNGHKSIRFAHVFLFISKVRVCVRLVSIDCARLWPKIKRQSNKFSHMRMHMSIEYYA